MKNILKSKVFKVKGNPFYPAAVIACLVVPVLAHLLPSVA